MTSRPFDLLLAVRRDDPRRLGVQVEDQIRRAIRDGALQAGARLPSTRDLARELGVSRPIVVDAYGQLASEGYLSLRQGSRPRVAATVPRPTARRDALAEAREPAPRLNLLPALPDLGAFPRAAWLRSYRDAAAHVPDDALGYAERHGTKVLRAALVEYLGRVRGVTADPEQVLITSGYAQGRVLACRVLRAHGVRRIAVEDPSYSEWEGVTTAGLEMAPVAVDGDGLRSDDLWATGAGAVMVTPSHQFPTGVVLTGARRNTLLSWLRTSDAVVIEDDYDAEFRYDRPPVGALQGLEPDRVIYAGTASKMLAPGLRLGWLVVPVRLLDAAQEEHRRADFGCPRLDQYALADFIARGELDRHLRRMRVTYRRRREVLVQAVAREIPGATVRGLDAGLHACVELSADDDERAIQREAARRGIAFEVLGEHRISSRGAPALLLGYGRASEPTIRQAVKELGRVIDATRRRERRRDGTSPDQSVGTNAGL